MVADRAANVGFADFF